MTTIILPPLPEPDTTIHVTSPTSIRVHSIEAIRAYATAVSAAATAAKAVALAVIGARP